ncbi:TetR/AcrR family transcriptional regulator [Nocardioides mangrovicus]|nr:TetR/AcrR family transcriptional regulator [Nocardioides mangrovicus]
MSMGKVDRVRAKAAKRARRRPLSKQAMVDVALRIVDTEGTEAVSMRRVAAEFDTGPASLYAHVRDKDELLRLVLDRVIDEMEVPTADAWQDVVRGFAHNVRSAYQRHADVARLSFAHIPTGEKVLAGSERLLRAMIEAGVPDRVAAWALDILSLYVGADAFEGWIMQQRFSHDARGRPVAEVDADFVASVQHDMGAMPADRYPYLARALPVMTSGTSDERFSFGVDMLIAGFAAQIPEQP